MPAWRKCCKTGQFWLALRWNYENTLPDSSGVNLFGRLCEADSGMVTDRFTNADHRGPRENGGFNYKNPFSTIAVNS